MELLLIFCLLSAAAVFAISRIGRSGSQPERGGKAQRKPRAAPAAAVPAAQPPAAPAATPATAPAAESLPPVPEPTTNVERRTHARLHLDRTFSVSPFAGETVMAVCHDVSLGGMRFGVVGTVLREGDLVRVTFNVGEETIAAVGRVLRTRNLDPITSDVSLEFVRLDPWAARLIEEALAAGD